MTELQCGNCRYFQPRDVKQGEDVSGVCENTLQNRFYADWCDDWQMNTKHPQLSTAAIIAQMKKDAARQAKEQGDD